MSRPFCLVHGFIALDEVETTEAAGWILDGKIKSVKTRGGHHRVTLASLKPYLEGHGRIDLQLDVGDSATGLI